MYNQVNTLSKLLSWLLFILVISQCQQTPPTKVRIQSRKYSAISGQEAMMKVTPIQMVFTVPYTQQFATKPDVGLSVYNMQFDYNPEFSIGVLQEVSTPQQFQFYVIGRPSEKNIYNELFIMYIASDYQQLGVYMPGPLNTTARLGISSRDNFRSQQFVFNYKSIGPNGNQNPIFPPNADRNNIQVTVYLTGIDAESETVSNGYPRNSAFFSLSVQDKTISSYTIIVKLRSSGDAIIRRIEFTVVYFDISAVSSNYLMRSNSVVVSNFGGTVYKSSVSIALQTLPEINGYQNVLQYFFGISEIECLQGQTINLLAVERFNYNNGKLQNLVLTFETKDNTTIKRGVYNYIQYKPITCNDLSVNCGFECSSDRRGYPISPGSRTCLPCLYFCDNCTGPTSCERCPPTRVLTNDNLCTCINNTYYDDQKSLDCQSCFQKYFCQTCNRQNFCLTCYNQNNFVLNTIKRKCQCKAGFYNGSTSSGVMVSNKDIICIPCPPQCIYCKTPKTCEACTVPYFLMSNTTQIDRQPQACAQICQANQRFNQFTLRCDKFLGDTSLFDSNGRLGFDWKFKNVNNQLIIDLLFSQKNMTYYFYQNGKGYQYVKTTIEQTQRNKQGQSSLYYDDGNGYKRGFGNEQINKFASSVINTKITQQTNGNMFDPTALLGEYYGLGQSKFFSERYKQLLQQQRAQKVGLNGQLMNKAAYYDQFQIPFGKHQLNSTKIDDSATFLDAIRNNLIFTIDNQSLPYTIKALSQNLLQLTVQTGQTFLTSNASIIFKNPALVRSGQTALQTPVVSKQIDRLDYYVQNQLSTGLSLRDRTMTIVQILWGICKYILFIGFGWAVMPLMLILQYIFGYNYITSQLPLNLDYFLTSFADFRNPSILFNPQRNQFDSRVVNHDEIYKRVSQYYQFDRGIDFMKNSFQFFFTPLLSFALQFLFIGLNCLLNMICKRDIPIISKYFLPRLPLHAGAYTLVQALPISFFFFGQLQDQRYRHERSPNSIYPSFNAGISYASFFASAIIPLVLLTLIYHYFQKLYRSGTFQLNKIQANDDPNRIISKDPAMMDDPLWGGNPQKPLSYGFGASVFYLPLLAGFVLSYFTKSYPWQLTGLLLGNTALASFALGSHHFLNKIPKFFFAGISALMVGYLLVHAGVGSNRALSTYDQWNTGYVGIGIIYAMILAGILFSGYLLYRLFSHLYRNIIVPYGCFRKLSSQQVPTLKTVPGEQEINLRDKALGRDQIRKTTIAQSKINILNGGNVRNETQHELNAINKFDSTQSLQNQLEYVSTDINNRASFRTHDNMYIFPPWSSQKLKKSLPLKINNQKQIYTYKNGIKNFIGTVKRLSQQQQHSQNSEAHNRRSSNTEMQQFALQMVRNNNTSSKIINTMNINNKAYNYREDQMGNFYVMNYMGNPQYKMSDYQFINVFNNNKNTVNYQNDDYYISSPYEQNGQYVYYLVNPNTLQKKMMINRQNLLALLANTNKNPSIRNIVSIPTIPSKKSTQQYAQYNPTQKSIIFTKNTQQYLINGKAYEKQYEDAQLMYFRNVQTGQKIKVPRSQTHIRATQSEIRTGSLRDLVQNKIHESNDMLVLGGENYRFKDIQNSYYVFTNVQNNSIRSFNLQQLAEIFGYRPNLVSSNQNINVSYPPQQQQYQQQQYQQMSQNNIFNPSQAVQLKLHTTNVNQQVYIFIDPYTQQQYQMPFSMCDLNQKVYLDKDQHIWHRGQRIGFQSQISSPNKPNPNPNNYNYNPNPNYTNVVSPVTGMGTPYRPPHSQHSIHSQSSTASLNRNLNPNQLYNINIISNTYTYSETRLPSNLDIIGSKTGIRGANVQAVMNQLKRSYPQSHVLIQSVNNPNQKMFIHL